VVGLVWLLLLPPLFTGGDCTREFEAEASRDGPLLVARVPVANAVCRLYRDDEIRVQLQYDDRGRLGRAQADMNPYRSLPIQGHTIHWGR